MQSVKNMSKIVEAKYLWDEATALLSSELFYKYEFRHSYRRYVGWVFIAMAQFGVVGALKHDAYGMLILSSFLLLYWYGIRWQLRKRLILRHFRASDMADKEIITTFDETGIHTGVETIAWKDVQKVVELEAGFLFYSVSKANFFPKTSFKSAQQREALRTLLKKADIILEKES